MTRALLYAASAFVALALLTAFHHVMEREKIDQWERAAYLHWQGQCKLPAYDLLCTPRPAYACERGCQYDSTVTIYQETAP